MLLLAVLPLVVSAAALLLRVGGSYFPSADHALIELQTRDVGRHAVEVGLYSRSDWNHPGPLLFYVLAPIYWLFGGSSVGADVGALVINGASVVGMGLIARRRGGTALLVCTMLGCVLLMRTLGAEFLGDPWNCFVTALPFGLLVFLTWELMCGNAWALPIATFGASFLAQTHVGFVLLALPLLALGTVWLVVVRRERWRELARPGIIAAAVGALSWLPVALDVVFHSPSNLRRIVRWFRHSDEGTHTLAEGWRVVTGQFALKPEWLTTKQPMSFGGQSPFVFESPVPWLLGVVAVAGLVLWRWKRPDDRRLVVLLGVTLVLSIVAVVRTVGPAFDYRLRWTWIPPLVAFVLVLWAGVQLVTRRWPAVVSRGLAPLAAAVLVVVTGVNSYTAATAGVPLEKPSAILEEITPELVAALEDDRPGDGQVLVEDPYSQAGGYARGLVLQLERRGIDARVPRERTPLYGEHRVLDDGSPIRARLVVAKNDTVASLDASPDLRVAAEWHYSGPMRTPADQEQVAELWADLSEGRINSDEFEAGMDALDLLPAAPGGTFRVGVLLDLSPAYSSTG